MVPGLNIPIVALGVIVICCGEFFTASAHFMGGWSRIGWSAGLTAGSIGLCRWIVRKDYNAFRLLFLAVVTRSKSIGTFGYWRGSSLSPVRNELPRKAARIPYAR